MYSILIIDDEEPVLDSYSYLIKTEAPDFSLCGKARTGNEAIGMILQHKPDVVFMDISMPGMDGIEVIERLHDSFSDTVFVLSTAFERFDIAQRAIPLGIFAYLVKPVSKKMFIKTINDIKIVLEKRQLAPNILQKLKIDFFTTTMHHPMDDVQWEKAKELFHFTQEQFCVIMVRCPEHFRSELVKRLSFKYKVYESNYLSLIQLLIPLPKTDFTNPEEDIASIAADLIPQPEHFAVAAGSIVSGQNLYVSCTEAFDAIKRLNTSALVEEQKLITSFRRTLFGDKKDVLQTFESLTRYLFSFCDFTAAKLKLHGAFMLAADDLFTQYSAQCTEPPVIDITAALIPIQTVEDIRLWGVDAIDILCTEYVNRKSHTYSPPLTKAIELLETKYAQPVQLSSIALEAGVSEPYLSRLFTSQLHIGFSDYVQQLRIDKAKELLRTNASIKEVAFSVGFQDQNYFTRTFRKVTGQTPSGYKEELDSVKGANK